MRYPGTKGKILKDKATKKHYLKHQSSYIVVILKSLRHKGCVCCNYPIKSLDESSKHWDEMLERDGG